MKGRVGYTLIEIMISIAILVIVMAVPMATRAQFSWLAREADYRDALRNARWQMEELRRAPFDSLPPRPVHVSANATVQLPRHLVPHSVTLYSLAGNPVQGVVRVDEKRGLVQVRDGQDCIVDYRYEVPTRGECHTVPRTAPYRIKLDDTPLEIDALGLARGSEVTPLHPSASSPLDLPAALQGHVVVVDYLGARIHNIVSGRFLTDDTLQPSRVPTHTRLLRIDESYADSAVHFSMDVLRVQP